MDQDSASAVHAPVRDVLAKLHFRRLWIGQLVSVFGDLLALFAVFSAVSFRLRGSASDISLILVCFLLPFALVGPVAGVFVDRWNVKGTMILSDLIRAGLVLLLVFATQLWQIYAIFLVLSTVSTFFVPAQSVMLPLIMNKEELLAANALMQQSVQLVRIAAPATAGSLVGWLGENSCYYLDGASFLFSAMMIGLITIPARETKSGKISAFLEELLSGIRFILGHGTISFVVLSLAAGTFAMSCFSALVAVYVRDILHGGSLLFGAVNSVISLGVFAGAILIRKLAGGRSPAHLVTAGILGVGMFVFLLAAFNTRAVAFGCCFAIGFSVAFILVASSTLLQQETPVEMRGRVSSSSVSLIALTQGIAMLFAGSIAARIGIVQLYQVSAVLLLLIAAVGYRRLRQSPS